MSLLQYFRRGVAATLIAAVAFGSYATTDDIFDPFTASIEENIKTPAVTNKQHMAVVSAMAQLVEALKNMGYTTSTVRNNEVVLVTISCSKLFAPNSSTLKENASSQLHQLVPYVKRTVNYKVVVAVHADNSGDASYSDQITADRASAIDEYFSRETGAGENSELIPYGLGADEPIASNEGIGNRAANRRVEIYFIPTKTYIDKAKNRK